MTTFGFLFALSLMVMSTALYGSPRARLMRVGRVMLRRPEE